MARAHVLLMVCLGLAALAFASVSNRKASLIWNRTESAPLGLYWQTDGPLTRNGWAVLSARSEAAQWSAVRGYIGRDWPILKRIVGVEGDRICRDGLDISLNGHQIAAALESDSAGRAMPVWSGCFTLRADEYFLLNAHEASLDGRYFGASERAEISGSAIEVWTK